MAMQHPHAAQRLQLQRACRGRSGRRDQTGVRFTTPENQPPRLTGVRAAAGNARMETMTNTFPGLPAPPPPRRDDITDTSQTVAAGQLRALIERIERLEEEKRTLSEDIKDIYAEAKGNGFDTKAIKTIVALRRLDRAEREEAETILELYMAALGMA